MRNRLMAMEAIDFQKDKKFFNELVEVVTEIREHSAYFLQRDLSHFYKHEKVVAVLKCIKKHTNINVIYDGPNSNCGPCVMLPYLTRNHVFDLFKEFQSPGEDYRNMGGLELLDQYKKKSKVFIGTVNLKNSKVGGVFSEQEMMIGLPSLFLMGEGDWRRMGITPEEVAGIILHEVGHCFTYFEYLDRVVTTNQALSGIARAYTNNDPAQKKIVVAESKKILDLNQDEVDALINGNNVAVAATILIKASSNKCISELGASVYDTVGCEQLADQYATRQGGGVHVVTGLDKIIRSYGTISTPLVVTFVLGLGAIIALVGGVAGLILYSAYIGFMLILLLCGELFGDHIAIYDDDITRYNRIKHDLIGRLKSPFLIGKERDSVLEDIEAIEKIVKCMTPETLGILGRLRLFLSKAKTNLHNSEMLQKQLEEFASNNLFVHSAKIQQALG